SWLATDSADAIRLPLPTGAAPARATVPPPPPALATFQMPATAVVGSTVADTATVTGGFNPTGTVTFRLYSNPNGVGVPLFTDTEPFVGGMAPSARSTVAVTGTDFCEATYDGDATNIAV